MGASVVVLGMVGLSVIDPWGGGGLGRILEAPEVVLPTILLTMVVGWWAGAAVSATGIGRAAGVGVGAGIAWIWLGIAVAVIAAYVDSIVRGAASVIDLGPTMVWAIYGLVMVTLIGSVVAGPVGLIWGVTTWVVVRRSATRTEAVGHPHRAAALALVIVAVGTGVLQAGTTWQPDARCLDTGGERPLDGAFSPDGRWLAIVASDDENAGGTIHLLRWPSGDVVETWHAWVEHEIAVDSTGRVYWTAWEYREPWRGGLMTAAPGSDPTWLATGDETGLWFLTWTDGALRGVTSNSHRVASLPLDGSTEPSLDFAPRSDAGGAYWASPDGRTIATSPEWEGTHVTITRPDGSTSMVRVPGDPRSIALTPDGTSLVVAGWSGGTRLFDISTGDSRLLLRRSQAWIAVSPQGDLAWADEEQVGPGQVCVAPKLADHVASTGSAVR
jgi:hypothetical protein